MNYTYKTTNLINSKVYYGVHKTDNLDDGYLGSGKLLKQAIKKYGKENFKKEILEFYSSFEEALKAEEALITPEMLLDEMCYNVKLGGRGGSSTGGPLTPETRSKISKANSGKNAKFFGRSHTKETKAKMSSCRKGIEYSESTIEKLSSYAKNRPKEHKKKLADANKDKRPIKSICIKTGLETCYNCRIDAAHELGVSSSNIAKAANGKIKYAYGHYWEYL